MRNLHSNTKWVVILETQGMRMKEMIHLGKCPTIRPEVKKYKLSQHLFIFMYWKSKQIDSKYSKVLVEYKAILQL